MKPAASLRKVGLARALSKLGYCSRSQATELIRRGLVRLNGAVRRDPETPVGLEQDRIAVDRTQVSERQRIYLMLNKPRGVVTTASDEKGRRTVYDCLEKPSSWVAPVGRLDKASEGLLLLTNDSEWADRLSAPKTHLDKTYRVQIDAIVDDAFIKKLHQGIRAEGGDFLRVKCASILRHGGRNSWLEITLDEGKNRHIRRLLERLGVQVLRLVRIAIGPLLLGQLAKGEVRPLTMNEKQALDEALKPSAKPEANFIGLVGTAGSFISRKPRHGCS